MGESLSRSTRLLSIYTRLIRHQSINKTKLSEEFDVSERTVKRDIREIQNYFYESEEFLDKQDIKFDYSTQEYHIPKKSNLSRKRHEFETLIILLIVSNVPVWLSTIQFLKSIVLEFFMQDKAYLYNLINQIKKEKYHISHSQLLELQNAINQAKKVQLSTQKYNALSVLPVQIKLQNETLLLFYLHDGVEDAIPLHQIKDVRIVNVGSKAEPHRNKVTLKMNEEMFLHLKQYYHVNSVEQNADNFMVSFNMTENEAINLCTTYSSEIKLIGPKSTVDKLKVKILNMLNTYLID